MAKSSEPKIPSVSLSELQAGGPILLVARVGGQEVQLGYAEPRNFSTGSYGYNLSGKVNLPTGNKLAKLQMSINITVVNSKEAPAEFKTLAGTAPSEPSEESEAA